MDSIGSVRGERPLCCGSRKEHPGDKAMSSGSDEILPRNIRIAAAIIGNREGRILLVRKQGTRFFMQPGGKLHPGETAEQALARELQEEIGCTTVLTEFLGTFIAPAANEPLHMVEALLFRASISGEIQPSAEIEEAAWIEPSRTGNLPLAPLTRDHVLPLVRSGDCPRVAQTESALGRNEPS